MIDAVERAIGEYEGRKSTIPEPRPANILAAIRPVGELAEKLTVAIPELDATSRRLLFRNGLYQAFGVGSPFNNPVDEEYLLEYLSNVRANAKIAEDVLDPQESRRGERQDNRQILINRLCEIFDKYSRVEVPAIGSLPEIDNHSSRKRKDAPLHPHRLKIDFVSAALKAAKIRHPKGQNLARLFPRVK